MEKQHNLECVSNTSFFNDGARAHIYQCSCGFEVIFKSPLNEIKVGDTDKEAERLHNLNN